MRRKDVSTALKLWGLKAEKVKRVRSVFKVWTVEGVYALKSTKDSSERIRFFDSVLTYVQNKGFTRLAPYIPTMQKEPFGFYNDSTIVLTPWIDGKELRYRSLEEVREAIKVLAYFHQIAQGYQPEAGVVPRDKQGKWVEKLARRYGDIEYYRELAEKKQSKFDQAFLKAADWVLGHTRDAYKMMRESSYYQKVVASKEIVQICHGDPASRNFVMDYTGKVNMIDFDSMKYDLPIVDVWRFLRRIMSRDQWDLELVKILLADYSQIRSLDQVDYQLLAIYLTFPEKIWRILRKYYEKPGQDDWSESKYLRKLNQLLAQSQRRDRFLQEFNQYILGLQEVVQRGNP